ncbi:MAG: hypothetical protein K6F17_04050 [Lachnospiraceae bacterium]|nr:hypothetical protein [Lachnospiraceae bacterium]
MRNTKRLAAVFVAAVMSIACVFSLAGAVQVFGSEAGFFVSDPDINPKEGDHMFADTYNKVTVNANGLWSVGTEPEAKFNGDYVNFQRYIKFNKVGSFNSLSFQATVTQPTQLIVFVLGDETGITGVTNRLVVRNFAQFNVDKEHRGSLPAFGVTDPLVDSNGDYYVVPDDGSSQRVQKIVYQLPEAGTYHVYLLEGSAKFYGMYFGGLSDTEARALGKVIEDKTISEIKNDDEVGPVFWIGLVVFVLGLVAFVVMVDNKGGKGTTKSIFGKKKSSGGDITYNE